MSAVIQNAPQLKGFSAVHTVLHTALFGRFLYPAYKSPAKLAQNRAEIPAERTTELNDLVAIGQREALLTNLSTFRQYPFLAIFIQDAIKEDIDTLPLFIWSYNTNNAVPLELKLIRAAKFMFTRFVDACTSAVPPSSTSKRDYERTLWVRYTSHGGRNPMRRKCESGFPIR